MTGFNKPNRDEQQNARRIHSSATSTVWPFKSKMGFEMDEASLVHGDCGTECEEAKLLVLDDTKSFFRFILLGWCSRCRVYVWAHESIDADGRVRTYGSDRQPISESILEDE